MSTSQVHRLGVCQGMSGVQHIFPRSALAAFDLLPAGVLVAGLDDRAVYVNTRLCNLLGFSRNDAAAWDGETLAHIQQQGRAGSALGRETRLDLVRDGRTLSIVVSTAAISEELLMTVVQDVTQFAESHAALQADVLELRTQLDTLISRDAVPMCMTCGDIRLRDGSWVSPPDKVAVRGSGAISHGFCPLCTERYLDSIRHD